MEYEWDENKCQRNLEKHGLDFNNAHLVYESPCKLTLPGKTKVEPRLHDLAEIEGAVVVLSCVYTLRGKRPSGLFRFARQAPSCSMKRIVSHTSEELKAIRARGESKTDWERVRRDSATDAPVHYDPEVDPYDPNDAAAVEAYWATAKIIRGPGRPRLEAPKKLLPIRYDLSIIEAFKATGKGWQTRMNDALRTYLEEHPLNQA